MKTLVWVFSALLFVVGSISVAGGENSNVLSYYAVGNSLDGQLLVDGTNVLRFYPVYAMREAIDSVKISIYTGSDVFRRKAESLDGNAYWQVLLPVFKLGQAIQRIEVEAAFRLDSSYSLQLLRLKELRALDEQWLEKLTKEITERKSNAISSASGLEKKRSDLQNDTANAIEWVRQLLPSTMSASHAQDKSFAPVASAFLFWKDTLGARMDSDLAKTTREIQSTSDSIMGQEKQLKGVWARQFQLRQDTLAVRDSALLLIPESDRPQYALRSYSEIAAIVKSDTTVAKKIDSLDDKRKKVISEMGSLPDLVSRVESARKSHVERQEVLRRDSSRIEGSIDSLRQKSLRFIALDSIRSVRVHSITLLLQTKSEIEDTLRALDANFKRISSSKAMYTMAADTLVRRLRHEIEMGLVDTLYSGPSVRPSDLVIDPSFTSARILYRNYKRELRYMPALDPAERMGIFRIRYVPFPVAGLPGNPKTTLRGPFGENPTVFEVGLAFGDAIVPGDEFVVPEFSSKRLGVAFAVTEKLFNDDARIIGLVLTYDFNSYGSIGIGGNFAQHETNPYFSFGINKKAFEAVLSGLAGLFK